MADEEAKKPDITARLRKAWPTKKAEEAADGATGAETTEDNLAIMEEAVAEAAEKSAPWWKRFLAWIAFWRRPKKPKTPNEDKEPFRLERLAFWKRAPKDTADPEALFADVLEEKPGKPWGLIAAWCLLLAALGGAVAYLVIAPPPAHKNDPMTVLAVAPPTPEEIKLREEAVAAAAPGTEKDPVGKAAARNSSVVEGLVDTETGPAGALSPAPDPKLQMASRNGQVPRIGPDGRKPWMAYARPFNDRQNRPRVALVITDLGLIKTQTDDAIDRLPRAVTLAVSPYGPITRELLGRIREAGFESLMQMPLEPSDYPTSDPGPRALFTSLSTNENEGRLDWIMARGAGYVGMIDSLGTRVLQVEELARAVLGRIQERGLLFVDTRASARSLGAKVSRDIGLPLALNNRFLDVDATPELIDQKLDELERLAKQGGAAVGIGAALPVTIDRIREWAKTVGTRGVVLAPVSAVVNRQRD